ncbi:MAG TPA: TOBE domain-containing protein [Hanamia sp.]
MNKIPGIIHSIQSESHLSLVRIKAYEDMFSSIVVDTPVTAPYLMMEGPVNIVFKENEVAIAKGFSGQISLQNRFVCVIKKIEKGKLLCKVLMNYNEHNIISVITANAATQMDLTVGDNVIALVKTNEISLSPHD